MDSSVLFNISQGVYILGANENGKLCGCVIDAVMQSSVHPLSIAISCMNTGYTKSVIERTNKISLSVLGMETRPEVFDLFGHHSSKNTDKWAQVPMGMQYEMPFLKGAVSVVFAHIIDKKVLDSHTLFLCSVDETTPLMQNEVMTYDYYLKNIKPTVLSLSQSANSAATDSQKVKKTAWVCRVCGYVYEGDIPFEDLPATWVCPLCGVGKDEFDKLEV